MVHRILISGYYGFQNLGDELILDSILDNLSSRDLEITVLAAGVSDREGVRKKGEASIRWINRSLPWKVCREIMRTDCLLFGGGGLLQDMTSLWSLLYYLFLLYFSLILKKRVIVFAQGIGPLRGRVSKILVKKILKNVNLLTVRDEPSKHRLDELRIGTVCHVIADPVFLLGPSRPKSARNRDRFVIAVCLRPWHEAKFWSLLCGELKKILFQHDVQLVFIPFHKLQDISLAKETIQRLDGEGRVRSWETPSDIFSIYEGLDMVLGMRYHSIILAALMKKPFIGIRCDPKVEYLMESMGQTVCDVREIGKRADSIMRGYEEFNSGVIPYCKGARERAAAGIRLLRKYIY